MTDDLTPREPLLSVADLTVTYRGRSGSFTAVRDVSFTIGRGETVALVGESGSGKTTIGRTILGLHRSSVRLEGSIVLGAERLTGLSPRGWRRVRGRRVSLVPQDPQAGLNPVHPIGAQVAEVLVRHRLATRSRARELAVIALEEAGLDDAAGRYSAYPHELSGGQRQRVLIAIAAVARPELIVADEPTSALDVTVQKRILDQLDLLIGQDGTSMLLITHDLGVATDRADRVVVLEQGRVVEELPGRELLVAARQPYTRRLAAVAPSLGARPLVGDLEVSSTTAAPGPSGPSGPVGPVGPVAADRVRTGERPLLDVRGLGVTFPARRGRSAVEAITDLDLRLHHGESVGVVGESGSGKTTLARVLLGLQDPTRGEVEIDGAHDPSHASRAVRQSFRRTVQPVFQDPYSSLDPARSVGWSIAEPLRALSPLSRADRRTRVLELLDQVVLPASIASRRPRELSGGQLQRVAIARALSLGPRLLVCDEPVSSLDVSVQDQILRLLARLHEEQGLSLVFISHDLAVVRLLCTRVLVMHRGEVVEDGGAVEVFESPQHEYTQQLVAAVPGQRTP